MIQLKDYQTRVLDSLRGFFRQCSRDGHPANAFHDLQVKNLRDPIPYLPVHAAGLAPDMPYVCLRVPTGGGKTLLACHTAGIAMKELLRAEQSVVLWLVPRSTILQQTADALRDNRHPYRRALEMECGSVEVVTIDEALRLSRAAVDGQTVVIVATIQSFRAEDTTGRKVYAQNGSFAEHLQNVPSDRLEELLPGADGKPIPSLVNMLRLRRPIVIVDEAHNARTDLSFSMLGDVKPSCIIEFTATPARKKNPSNVLHMVSAAELNAANMVKLPLRVFRRDPSQRDLLLADAITLRGDLEKQAVAEGQATGEYIRPIMLIQAERIDDCQPLRERMAEEFGLQKDTILISTGKLDELAKEKDIESPKCPVRFIITVQKLSEGWDCPFAYVLCSLKQTRSATAIEQIVGRILRLPKVEKKQNEDLNCSYAFSVSDSLGEVLAELRDALESNGFTKAEAERIVLPVSQGVLPMGVQPRKIQVESTELETFALESEVAALDGKVRFDQASGELTIYVPLEEAELENLSGCLSAPDTRRKIREAANQVREAEAAFGGEGAPRVPSAYERQLDFIIPLLSVCEDGRFFEFEKTFLLEQPWKLSAKDASLSANYNPLKRPIAQRGILDVGNKGQVTTSAVQETADEDFVRTLHQQVLQLGASVDWTVESLIAWLDRRIDHADIPYGESAEFLRKVVRGLMTQFEIEDVSLLALDRYRLCDQIETRIRAHRDAEHKQAFQSFLFPDSSLQVVEEVSINFKSMVYEPSQTYSGNFKFKNHYFGPRPGELEEKTPAGKQSAEFKCAQYLDNRDEVECWIRNLARKKSSFRLQTSTDWFYPDFVCLLKDGRVAAIEYKGKHIYSAEDASEKRAVGAVWAARSGGDCLFIMPEGDDFDSIGAAFNQ
jgi:type III restriction enzyme